VIGDESEGDDKARQADNFSVHVKLHYGISVRPSVCPSVSRDTPKFCTKTAKYIVEIIIFSLYDSKVQFLVCCLL